MDKHFKWKHLEDLNFIAAMGAARGVRYDIDERFLARFFMFNVPPPEDDCLCDIYTTLLTGHLSSFAEKVKICARPLVQIMLSAFRVSGLVAFLILALPEERACVFLFIPGRRMSL